MLLLVPGLFVLWIAVGLIKNSLHSWKYIRSLPPSIAWAGCRDELLPKLRASVREVFAGLQSLQAGYVQHCKNGHMFVAPDPGLRPQIMIPQKYISWFAEQPESILSARIPQVKRFALDYLAPTVDWSHDAYLIEMLRKDFTRNLGKLQPQIVEDLRLSLRQCFGDDPDNWHEANIWSTMETLVYRTTLPMFVGPELARKVTFRNSIGTFSTCLGAGAVVVGQLTPSMFKPLLGYAFAVPVFISQKIAFLYLIPQIRIRMENLRRAHEDPDFTWEEPKDLMMYAIKASYDRENPSQSQPNRVAERLLFLMLGAIPTSIITSTNVFLDLLSSPQEYDYLARLRQEADQIFLKEDDWNDQAKVRQLTYTDSAIRETLRKTPVTTRVAIREILSRDGLVFPDGTRLPQGTWAGIPTVGLHHDESFCDRPQIYDPFRFVRDNPEKDDVQAKDDVPAGSAKDAQLKLNGKSQGASTASDTYVPWGYGRHSCPGRWFAVMEIKLLLAYFISHYDFQPLTDRPLNRVFGENIIPSRSTNFKLRAR